MPNAILNKVPSSSLTQFLARRVLAAFLFTFIVARLISFLIMSRRIPDVYLHSGGTHIHHLNYGIFLLAGICAYLLFKRPAENELSTVASLYGVGLALTFDEFGMWLHLGGSYWQRASFDAIMVIAGLLALIAFTSKLKQFRPRHWVTAVLLAIALVTFGIMLIDSFKYAGRLIRPEIQKIEASEPK